MWDVFRVSADKLALCHLELMRKMNDLIRDINKYGDEQVKIHRRVRLNKTLTDEQLILSHWPALNQSCCQPDLIYLTENPIMLVSPHASCSICP